MKTIMIKKLTRNILLVSTLILVFSSGCKKEDPPKNNTSTIGDGYFVVKFKDQINRDRVDTTFTSKDQINTSGAGYVLPFEKYGNDGFSSLSVGGNILELNTNPTLLKSQYTSPSNTRNLTSSNSFYIRFYDPLGGFEYLVKTGSLNLTEVVFKKNDNSVFGDGKEYIFVTGKWSGTWVNKRNNSTTNGELILVNACFPK